MISVAEVEQIVKRIVGSVSASIMAFKDGILVSDGFRALNFQGGGVTVASDPLMRRTNVIITGSPNATADTVIVSGTTFKGFNLWNGSSNDAPPANWFGTAFSDAGWSASVVATDQTGWSISGTSGRWVATTPASNTQQALFRQTFTLPAGTISAVSLQLQADDELTAIYVNGVAEGAGALGASTATISISPSRMVPGANNLIALEISNLHPTNAYAGFRLVVTYSSAGADVRYQLVSEKDQPNGYAGLDAGSLIDLNELGTGTPSGSNFLRGDGTWAPASTNSVVVQEIDASPSVAATTIEFPNGTLSSPSSGVIRYTPTSTATEPYVKVQDQKTAGTTGGAFTSGAWRTRTLNTEVYDAAGVASVASNQVTLQAGTYRFRGVAPGYAIDRHKLRLQNVTDGSTVEVGISMYARASNSISNLAEVVGRFTIAASKAFELQHQCETTNGTNGFGVESNFGVIEVYAVLEFWKES